MVEITQSGIRTNKASIGISLKHGLSKSESQLFFYLLKINNTQEMRKLPSIQQLAERIGISHNRTKLNLAKLNKLGLYETETNPDSVFWCGRQPDPAVIK